MLLYIARHGETMGNKEKRFQGHADFPLSSSGEVQARMLATSIAHLGLEAIYSSDLTRAKQTAGAVAAQVGVPLYCHPLFREYSFGVVEGLTHAEMAGAYPGVYQHLSRGHFITPPPGAESLVCFRRRLLCAWDFFSSPSPGSTALLVSHGRFINALLSLILADIKHPPYPFPVAPASLSALRFDEKKGTLVFLNDTCHLERNK